MINIIVAIAKNRVIGCRGCIPWNFPEDMEYFRKITTGGIVIMGRKTYEEIGRPLPERFNIVVSRSDDFVGENLKTATSLEDAIALGEKYASEMKISPNIFICGGQEIYKQGLKYAHILYITEIDECCDGDAFFPEFTEEQFVLVDRVRANTRNISFCVYESVNHKKKENLNLSRDKLKILNTHHDSKV